MSQIPPQGQGWIDANGLQQPGFPPPGFWQASDGRWYPPESADPAYFPPQSQPPQTTPQGPTSYAGPEQAAPPYDYTPQSLADAPTQAAPPGVGSSPAPAGPGSFPSGPPQQPAPSAYPPSSPPQFQPPQVPGGAPPAGPLPQGFAGAHPGPVPAGPPPAKTGLWVALAIAGVLFVSLAGLAAFLLAGGDDGGGGDIAGGSGDTTTETNDDSTDDGSTDSTTDIADTSDTTPDDTGTDEDNDSLFFPGIEDAPEDALSCIKVDDETIEVELVNNSSYTANYYLTIAFYDDGGARLSDTSGYITALRPNERTIEDVYIFEEPGTSCEVIETERIAVDQSDAALNDVSGCTVTGPDFVDDVAAEVSATNSSSVNSDYSVDVAIIGPDGIRRGTGFTYIEAVRPGETAPSEVFTTVDYGPDLTCEVVAVLRDDS